MIAPALRLHGELELELERVLAARRGHAFVLEIPAPVGVGLQLFDGPELEAAYFEAPGEILLVGLGVARQATASGPKRFEAVRRELEPELAKLASACGLGSLSGRPLALGGFAFEDALPAEDPWQPFGAARVVVPRWLYRVENRSASLCRVVEGDEDAQMILLEYEQLLQRLRRPGRAIRVSARRLEAEEVSSGLEEKIERARGLIRDRVFEKVVLAQQRRYELDAHSSAGDVLANLGAPDDGAVRFGFRVGTSTFVGSTPERLVAKRGATVETEAVAGSVVWDGVATEQHLLHSRKDLDEQSFVSRFIQEALEGVSTKVVASESPHIRRLAHVGHLVTRLEAEVDPQLHILDVARRLHPTPAVAGTPTGPAVEFIRAHEGFTRGWYAGAVGWFDAAGDGEFRVALRSGLIAGRSVGVFAGAGIVRDSEPAKELREIDSKHKNMKSAIGAES